MTVLIVLAATAAIWAVVASILITRDLARRGYPVNLPFLRLYVIKYVHQYREVTRAETGHTGALFYHYVVPLNVALVVAVVLALRSSS